MIFYIDLNFAHYRSDENHLKTPSFPAQLCGVLLIEEEEEEEEVYRQNPPRENYRTNKE